MNGSDNCRIKGIEIGPYATNCYLILNTETKEIAVIDPGGSASHVLDACRQMGGEPAAVLLTHGHTDHIFGIPGLKDAKPDLPVYVSDKDAALLGDSALNVGIGGFRATVVPDHFIKEGDRLNVCGFVFDVIETPGHTAGSVCFYMRDRGILFAGDTLFRGSYGRYDFPTSSGTALFESLQRLADSLPDETAVYPGHGPATTIGLEKRINPAFI